MIIEFLTGLVVKVAETVSWEGGKLAWRLWIARKERVVYNGRRGISKLDVRGQEGYRYSSPNQRIGDKAKGELRVVDNIIDVTRTNEDGQYHIFLQRVGRKKTETLEPDLSLNRRNLIFRFEAKTPNGRHILRPSAHHITQGGEWQFLGEEKQVVATPIWEMYEVAFSCDATRSARIRIDDQEVSIPAGRTDSSVQVRKLLVTELRD